MFKVDEILLLENLTYFSDIAPLKIILTAEGLTVKERKNLINKILREQDDISITKQTDANAKIIFT